MRINLRLFLRPPFNRVSYILFAMFISLQSPYAGNVALAVPNDLEKDIAEVVRASGAETVAVAYYDLASGRQLLINSDENFHAASTMKVPVMMEIYRQAAAHKLSLEDRIPIKNNFASIVDGSPYSLTADSDSEAS